MYRVSAMAGVWCTRWYMFTFVPRPRVPSRSRQRMRRVVDAFAVSSWLRCLSSRAIHLSPTLFTAAAVPADIAALNQKVEAAAQGTPLLSATSAQAARRSRAALFKHEPRRIDERIPGLGEGSPSVGIAIFMPRDGGEHGQS